MPPVGVVSVSFEVEPDGAGVIRVNGDSVTLGSAIQYPIGSHLEIECEVNEGYVFENWNDGMWFEATWAVDLDESSEGTTFLANLAPL